MKLESSRKYSLIFSALLIGYQHLGLAIEGRIPYTEITISSSTNTTLILTILSSYFVINFIYYWIENKKVNRSLFEIFITLGVSLFAIIPVIYSYLESYGIDWKVIVTSIALLSLGVILAVTVNFIVVILSSIRSKDEMQKMGLGKIPSASKAFIGSFFILIPLNSLILFLLIKYKLQFPAMVEEYWRIFYFSPTILINFDIFLNFLKCLGPKKIREKAIMDLKKFRKCMDMHEMHYQYIGIEPFRKYELPPICHYAYLGDKKSIQQLLENGVNPNIQDYRGWSPLMWASAERHVEVVQLLLEHGADPNLVSYLGRTAIGYAAKYGDYEICEKLIDKGAILNPTREFSDTPPLAVAAAKGHLNVVELFVKNGADIFYKSSGKYLAIDLAMKEKHGEVAKYLRNKMAEREVKKEEKTDFIKNTDWLNQ